MAPLSAEETLLEASDEDNVWEIASVLKLFVASCPLEIILSVVV